MGYRFRPTSKELMKYLLAFGRDDPLPHQYDFMQIVDLYGDNEPWKIFESTNNNNSNSRYFITPMKKKKVEHKRASRTVGNNGGTWKAQNKGKEVFDDKGRIMGYVKSLKYNPRNKNDVTNGEWLMTEYTLHDNYVAALKIKKKDFAICKIKKKERSSSSDNDKKKLSSVNDKDVEEFIDSVLMITSSSDDHEESNIIIETLEGDELEEHVFAAFEDDSDSDEAAANNINLDDIEFV